MNHPKAILAISLLLLAITPVLARPQAKPAAKPAQEAPAQTKQAPKATPAAAQSSPQSSKKEEEVIPPAKAGALFPSVVARVNGVAILGRDLEQRILTALTPIGNPKWENLREDYRQELVNQSLGTLVATELLHQKAVESGIKITQAEVNSEFEKVAKNFANDAALNTALAGRGIDRAILRKEIERNLVVAKFIQDNVTKKVVLTPEEVSKYYADNKDQFHHEDLVRTSHILINVPAGTTPEQENALRERAESLLARAKKGEDFAKLAKENSMDASASEGGDIGYVPAGQLAPEYEKAAFALAPGQISDLVRTQFGYHIIKVTDKRKAGLSSLEEVKEDLTQYLKDQRADEEVQKIVVDLRNKAKVEILIPLAQVQQPDNADKSAPTTNP